MGICRAWCHLILSFIGISLGLLASLVFGFIYHNLHASVWGFVSAVIASVVFHTHYLYIRERLVQWHSIETLRSLTILGVATLLIGLAGMTWYIFETLYKHIPILPVKNSTVIPSIWAFMTAKWGFMIILTTHHYKSHVSFDDEPLLS